MEPYVYKRRADGVHIIDLSKTYSKIILAARIIVTIQNPADVCAISSRPYGHRAVLKFAAHTGATAIAGRFTPGNFTNYITRSFKEPRLIITTDPRTDAQAIKESSYVNIPVISLADVDAPLEHVDVAIPTNNKGAHSIGLIWYLLAREVLRLRGSVSREREWEVMPDLYFYRNPEEEREEKDEETAVNVLESENASVQHAFAAGSMPAVQQADWTSQGGITGPIDPALAHVNGIQPNFSAGMVSEPWSAAGDWIQQQASSDWAAAGEQ